MSVVETSERQAYSSVEITKNTKGTTWAIKCYVLPGEEQVALMRARMIDEQLRAQYEAPQPKDDSDGD